MPHVLRLCSLLLLSNALTDGSSSDADHSGAAERCVVRWPYGVTVPDGPETEVDWSESNVDSRKDFFQQFLKPIQRHDKLDSQEIRTINAPWKASDGPRCGASTYGEHVVTDIFNSPRYKMGEGAVFVDLGSGAGKAVLHAVIEQNASRGVGVELSLTRHQEFCKAINRWKELISAGSTSIPRDSRGPVSLSCSTACRQRLGQGAGEIEAWHASMLDPAVETLLRSATHIFIFATCFPFQLMSDIEEMLLRALPSHAVVWITPFDLWGKRKVGNRRFRPFQDYQTSRSPTLMEIVVNEEL